MLLKLIGLNYPENISMKNGNILIFHFENTVTIIVIMDLGNLI